MSIQHSHSTSAVGYHQPYLRTGYESIIADRVDDSFCAKAKGPGKVISITDKGIIVEYDTGVREGAQLGVHYGKAEGAVYPHNIATTMKVGDVVESGTIIAYNDGFFEPDELDPNKVILKNYMLARTALYEAVQTHEDSCMISSRIAEKMTTKTTKVLSFTVEFKQGVKNVVRPGTIVKPMQPLFTIEDEVTNAAGLFDEESVGVLQTLSNKMPKSKVAGTLDQIEVFYHGAKEDMSPSLRTLADFSDKQMAAKAKAAGKRVIDGHVTSEYRIQGKGIMFNTAEIKIYITVTNKAGVGDKGVFANQLKTTISEVMEYDMKTEDGEPVEAAFSYKSIAARIVLSPEIIGTTNTLLKVVGRRAVSLYKGK